MTPEKILEKYWKIKSPGRREIRTDFVINPVINL